MSAHPSGTGLTLLDCYRAARRITAAPHGRRVRAAVRPRTVSGFSRDRAPLTLMLYVASRDGRLVWQGLDGLAMLEPPVARPRATRWRGVRHAVTHQADQHWGAVALGAPPAMAVLTGLAVLPFPGLRLVTVLSLLAAMVYVAVCMTAALLRAVLPRRAAGADATRLSMLSGVHWTMALFHQANEKRTDELFNRVRERLRYLLVNETAVFGRQAGIDVDDARLTEMLVCLHDGITTDEARERIAARHASVAWRGGENFSVSTFGAPPAVERAPSPPLAFMRLYLFAHVVLVFGLAWLLMGQERTACARMACQAAADSYGDALAWICYQLVYRQAPGVEPVSGFATQLGVVLTPLLPLAVLVVITATLRQHRYRDALRRLMNVGSVTNRLLIVTVTDTERDAVIEVFDEYTGQHSKPDFDKVVPTVHLGAIADTDVFLVQAPTAGGVGASTIATIGPEAIRDLRPDHTIIAGICYGLKPEEQQLGDVLVSAVIRGLDHAKFTQEGDHVLRHDRSERVEPSPHLHTVSRAAAREWQHESGVNVHFGEMLSWNNLVDARLVVESLRHRYPDAIGGEMEGAAFHAMARWAEIRGILIKAVCDWASGKNDKHQEMAAANSARFVLHLVRVGALARRRGRG